MFKYSQVYSELCVSLYAESLFHLLKFLYIYVGVYIGYFNKTKCFLITKIIIIKKPIRNTLPLHCFCLEKQQQLTKNSLKIIFEF